MTVRLDHFAEGSYGATKAVACGAEWGEGSDGVGNGKAVGTVGSVHGVVGGRLLLIHDVILLLILLLKVWVIDLIAILIIHGLLLHLPSILIILNLLLWLLLILLWLLLWLLLILCLSRIPRLLHLLRLLKIRIHFLLRHHLLLLILRLHRRRRELRLRHDHATQPRRNRHGHSPRRKNPSSRSNRGIDRQTHTRHGNHTPRSGQLARFQLFLQHGFPNPTSSIGEPILELFLVNARFVH
mmetsp:Transcript_6637/g.15049  ORF Transcript_6637/g.15049 Transcript_6637/m.15049 type:complete len:240 (-) Transcript_6637:599-1318(-)